MNFFGDLNFFIYLAIALVPAIILGLKQKKIRKYAIALTIFFILLIIGDDWKQLVYLILYGFIELHIVKMPIKEKIWKE